VILRIKFSVSVFVIQLAFVSHEGFTQNVICVMDILLVCMLHMRLSSYFIMVLHKIQGDHSPDNVKFPDNSVMVCVTPPGHSALSVTHIMPVLVLLSVVGVGLPQCMIRNHVFYI